MTPASPAWRGKRVLITAGPTREYLDPVRFLTNASSGAVGFAVAKAARELGARVTVVSGPVRAARPKGVSVIPVVTAREMHRQVMARCLRSDVVIAAAAVGDWRFKRVASSKIKRTGRSLRVELTPNADIIADAARRLGRLKLMKSADRRPRGAAGKEYNLSREQGSASSLSVPGGTVTARGKVLVGFALETSRMLPNARRKLRRKGLDMIVANSPASMGAGRIRFAVLHRDGAVHRFPLMSKGRAARIILREVEERL